MCDLYFLRARKGGIGGMLGVLRGLVGSKTLTQQDMEPVLEKMKDHLIGTSNVCHSITHDSPNHDVPILSVITLKPLIGEVINIIYLQSHI